MAGVLTHSGTTSNLIELWRDGVLEVVVSPRLLAELRETLQKPRIARRYPAAVRHAVALTEELATDGMLIDDPVDSARYVPADPDDDYLVALALAAGAGCLVTRDSHLEGVKVPGLRIVTPGRLIRELKARS